MNKQLNKLCENNNKYLQENTSICLTEMKRTSQDMKIESNKEIEILKGIPCGMKMELEKSIPN